MSSAIIESVNTKRDQIEAQWESHMSAFEQYFKQSNEVWEKWKEKMEAYDALVQQNTHNPSNKLSALLKEAELLKFECDIYDQYIDVHHAGYNKMMDRLERFDYIQKSAVKVEKVTKARLKRLAKEDCCICLSRHRPGDLVKTECQHMFGKSCFSALVKKSFFEDSEEVRCPLCRQEQQCLTVFVKRG